MHTFYMLRVSWTILAIASTVTSCDLLVELRNLVR